MRKEEIQMLQSSLSDKKITKNNGFKIRDKNLSSGATQTAQISNNFVTQNQLNGMSYFMTPNGTLQATSANLTNLNLLSQQTHSNNLKALNLNLNNITNLNTLANSANQNLNLNVRTNNDGTNSPHPSIASNSNTVKFQNVVGLNSPVGNVDLSNVVNQQSAKNSENLVSESPSALKKDNEDNTGVRSTLEEEINKNKNKMNPDPEDSVS